LLDHVHRVLAGQPIYPKPSSDFVATMYTPGYYYVSAAVAWMIGEGFVAPRLVSLVSSLAICALVFHAVRRETSDLYAASVSAFLLAATFRAAGSRFDLARPDSLCLALWLAAAVRPRFATRPRHDLVAGALLSASILTKQTALLLALPLAAHAIAT
jgi:4-amino-4-deoxy-L-arabinose transferase-like glycosyltransferase